MDYNTHIVAFIDILGFSELIKNAQHNNNFAIETIKKLTESIENSIVKNIDYKFHESDDGKMNSKYRIFSDCICISYDISKCTPDNIANVIFSFLQELLWVQAELAIENIFIRGGVSIDKHFQNDSIIFSSALVNSYYLESKKAIYPRIILDDSVIGYIRKYNYGDNLDILNSFIKRDPDNLVSIDYLSYGIQLGLDRDSIEAYLKKHKKVIEDRLKIESEPRVLQKYLWVANYHDFTIRTLKLNYKFKIKKELLSYRRNVFTPITFIFLFESKKENINNGIIFIYCDMKWKAIQAIEKYLKNNNLDYVVNEDNYLRIFENKITKANIKKELSEDKDFKVDKIIQVKI